MSSPLGLYSEGLYIARKVGNGDGGGCQYLSEGERGVERVRAMHDEFRSTLILAKTVHPSGNKHLSDVHSGIPCLVKSAC